MVAVLPSRSNRLEQCLPQQRCFAVADVYLRDDQLFHLEPAIVIFGQRDLDGIRTLIAAQQPDSMYMAMTAQKPDAIMFRGFEHYMNVRACHATSRIPRDRFHRAFIRTLMDVCDEQDTQEFGEQVLRDHKLWSRDDGSGFVEWNRRRAKSRREADDDYRDLPRLIAQALLGCVAAAVDSGRLDDGHIVVLNELAHANLHCSLHRYKRSAL
jgi:hypothetical protein